MEFDLKKFSPRLLAKLLTGHPMHDSGVITIWNSSTLGALPADDLEKLGWMIEIAGKLSAQAQGLRASITSTAKLLMQQQTLYLAVVRLTGERVRILGLLKTGRKKLFLRADDLKYHSREPVCVLDFYVQEQHQRLGIGKALFEVFLEAEEQVASSVAYDAPSPKLMAFLKKNYGHAQYEPQDNKFAVFPQFWELPQYAVPSEQIISGRWASVAARPLTPTRRRHAPSSAAGSRPATVHGCQQFSYTP